LPEQAALFYEFSLEKHIPIVIVLLLLHRCDRYQPAPGQIDR
jgi:hypothetical protein